MIVAKLAEEIEADIRSGRLAPGTRLAPIRALAVERSISPTTVAAVYRRLGERGLVVGRGRSGTVVSPNVGRTTGDDPVVGPGLVDLALGNPDAALLPVLPAYRDRPVRYGDAPLDDELAALARAALARDGIGGELTVVSGALDAIDRILGAHLRPGDRVVVEDPGYPAVRDLLAASCLEAVPVAVDDDGLDPDRLADVLQRRVQAVVLTPRAQNPTGAALTPERVGDLRSVLDAHPEVLVVEDDFAAAIAGAPHHPVVHEDMAHWAVARSMAKALRPDLRVAFLAGDATTVSRVEARQRLGPGWVSHLLQSLVAALLADPATAVALATASDVYASRRAALIAALEAQGLTGYGRSGLNVWVPVPDEHAAVARAAEAGFAVRPGERFRFATPPAVRVTTAALDPARAPTVAVAIAASTPGGRAG